jgi:hypothetical protein
VAMVLLCTSALTLLSFQAASKAKPVSEASPTPSSSKKSAAMPAPHASGMAPAPAHKNEPEQNYTPGGQPSNYRYRYSCGTQCRIDDEVSYQGRRYVVCSGKGANESDKLNPRVKIKSAGGGAEKSHSVYISYLTLVRSAKRA